MLAENNRTALNSLLGLDPKSPQSRSSTSQPHSTFSISSILFSVYLIAYLEAPEEWREASLMAQMVKNLPAMQKTWLPSLTQEDPLEEGMATHSSILAWRIPWTQEPGVGSQRGGHNWATSTFTFYEPRMMSGHSATPDTKSYPGSVNICSTCLN